MEGSCYVRETRLTLKRIELWRVTGSDIRKTLQSVLALERCYNPGIVTSSCNPPLHVRQPSILASSSLIREQGNSVKRG